MNHCYCSTIEGAYPADWQHLCCYCDKRVRQETREFQDPAHGPYAEKVTEEIEPPEETCPERLPMLPPAPVVISDASKARSARRDFGGPA